MVERGLLKRRVLAPVSLPALHRERLGFLGGLRVQDLARQLRLRPGELRLI
ncbi:hypothetical protein ACRAWG_20305 [Methylobacterium sp. P31]